MARLFGGNADFSFDGESIEDELNSVTMTFEVAVGDITAFSDTYQVPVAGKKSSKVDIAGSFDPTADQADDKIFDAFESSSPVTVLLVPGGGAASAVNPSYECTASGLTGALVENHVLSLPVGDKASFTSSIQLSGSTTRETS